MAVGLFITILLLSHQTSSSIQQSVQVDPSTSPNDRDEILSGDRCTSKSRKDCPDTVRLGSCLRELNETQQELVKARVRICRLQTEISTQNTEVRDGKTKIGELDGKINALQSKNSDPETQIRFERENKTAEIAKLHADLNRTMNLLDPGGWSYLAKTASWYKELGKKTK
ncbi:unnamed protein product, partial [Mesorhabditis belari]|uniref:Uncharacterized protein n=1 Tax=Mesorhabditis belari TaxID=2138241 RepID=A0AAF3EQH5_9BILA